MDSSLGIFTSQMILPTKVGYSFPLIFLQGKYFPKNDHLLLENLFFPYNCQYSFFFFSLMTLGFITKLFMTVANVDEVKLLNNAAL